MADASSSAKPPAGKKTAGLTRRQWLIVGGVVVAVVIGYYLYRAHVANAGSQPASGTVSSDQGSAATPATDTSGDSGGGGGSTDDLAGLLQYFETQDQQSSQTLGQIVAGEQGLEASQQALIGELAGNTEATNQALANELGLVETSSEQQLAAVASSAVGGLTAAATASKSAAAPAAAPTPAQTPAHDTEPNPGAQSAGPGAPLIPEIAQGITSYTPSESTSIPSGTYGSLESAITSSTAPKSSAGSSGAAAVKSGQAKKNTQAAKNARLG